MNVNQIEALLGQQNLNNNSKFRKIMMRKLLGLPLKQVFLRIIKKLTRNIPFN
jgi:hypothetical protein